MHDDCMFTQIFRRNTLWNVVQLGPMEFIISKNYYLNDHDITNELITGFASLQQALNYINDLYE